MAKTIYITESQFKTLVEKKKEEKKLYNEICEELDKKKATLTEATLLNEGILDTIKKYLRAGALTAGILASLLAAQKVDAQQLVQAGVPTELVQQAQQKVKHNPAEMSTKQIEDRLVQIMQKNNEKGSLQAFQQLSPQQKENVLNGIKSQIKSLDDVNHISVGQWQKFANNSPNAIQFDQQSKQVIRVVTVDTLSTIPVGNQFQMNSVKLTNPDSLKQELHDLVIGYQQIDSVVIESSSSTLRNTGEAEGMTWKELSQTRGQEVANLLVGMNVDLGGCGSNNNGTITSEMITINSDGANGDGTSGPKSPYEVSQEAVQSYQQRGIDAKFWQSASKEDALPENQLGQYQQYQYVTVKIYGRTVETETQDVPSFRYVVLQVKQSGGHVKKGNDKKTNDVSQCSVKVKKTEMNKNPFYK